MIFTSDMVTINVNDDDIERLVRNIEMCCIGGKSNVREGLDRQEHVRYDQYVGQVAEYCASVYLTGNATAYYMQRDIRNADKYNGDGGQDLYGIPRLDVKGRGFNDWQYLYRKELIVPKEEMRSGWIYVHCMIPTFKDYTGVITGWAMSEDFGLPYDGNIKWMRGKYVRHVASLRRICDLRKEIKSHAHDNSTFNHRIS